MLIYAAPLSALEPDLPKPVQIEGSKLLLVRTSEAVYAVSAICPHRGAPLEGGFVVEGVLVCPWHRAMFQLATGDVVGPPAQHPIRTFPVVIKDGDVYVAWDPA